MNYRDREVSWLTISYLMEVVFYSASSEKIRVWFQACQCPPEYSKKCRKPGGKDAHAIIRVGYGTVQD